MLKDLPLFPAQASTVAAEVDNLFFFLLGLTVFFSLLIALLLVVFAVRYRRRSEDERPAPIEGDLRLELGWTVIPFLITMVIFVWSAVVYARLTRAPDDALPVFVVGKQWMWHVQHLEGAREINEVHVPVGRAVRLTMTSEDVIHSFYVPDFRIKQDVLPGRYTTVWFEATRPGRYHLFCAEYCGTQHSGMIGWVIAMEPAEYEAWLAGGRGQSLVSAGEELFNQLGCVTCHSGESGSRGPNLAGVFGKTVQLASGEQVLADEGYLRESIVNPRARVVAGFEPVMPVFKGTVSEEQLMQLIAYIKALEVAAAPAAAEPQPAGSIR